MMSGFLAKITGHTKQNKTGRKEFKKIKAEVKKQETKTVEEINETKSWYFDKINEIDKPGAK